MSTEDVAPVPSRKPKTPRSSSSKGGIRNLEGLLNFLEERHVVNPLYSSYKRTIATQQDQLEHLEALLESMPLEPGAAQEVLLSVKALLPAEEPEVTLAEAMAQGGNTRDPAAKLDSKSRKQVSTWLQSRRHAYREERTSRVVKMLQAFQSSEQEYINGLNALREIGLELEALAASDSKLKAADVHTVFGDAARLVDVHSQQLTSLARVAGDAKRFQRPIEQRNWILTHFLVPMTQLIQIYGPFLSRHLLRCNIVEMWMEDPATARAVLQAESNHSSVKLMDLLSVAVHRLDGYGSFVQRLQQMLLEERSQMGSTRWKEDQETSAQLERACAELLDACSDYQASIAQCVSMDRALTVARQLGLHRDFAEAVTRRFVRQDRVEIVIERVEHLHCWLYLFSDVLVLSTADESGTNERHLLSMELEDFVVVTYEEQFDEGAKTPRNETMRSKATLLLRTKSIGPLLITAASETNANTIVNAILDQKYKQRVFGQPVSYLVDRDGLHVPEILTRCADIIRRRIKEEGIFRIPGRKGVMDELMRQVDRGVDFNFKDVSTADVAGLLKLFFRRLPHSIVPKPLVARFIDTNELEEHPKRRHKLLRQLIGKIPEAARDIFIWTVRLLIDVCKFEEDNKMNSSSLATIFAPALFFCQSAEQSRAEVLETVKLGAQLKVTLQYIIEHPQILSEDDE